MAVRDALADQLLGAFEVDEQDGLAGLRRDVIPVASLQGRAGTDGDTLLFSSGVECLSERRQPRPAIVVGQRNAGVHLRFVGLGMVVIAVKKGGVQAPRDGLADHRLAARRHAHGNDDAGWGEGQGVRLHIRWWEPTADSRPATVAQQ